MPQDIITDNDINFAEKILLKQGKTFNPERVNFIKELTTLDLQAVPGSGKTTALLAKLLILEKKLPFPDGSGILVISHTNTAINEIKDKLFKYCPKLFSYPNHIGTIQSFVDDFLAFPYYKVKYNKKPIRIDNEIYFENINRMLDKIWLHNYDLGADVNSKIGYIKNANPNLFYNCRFNFSTDGKAILTDGNTTEKLNIKKPKGNTREENYIDYTDVEKHSLYKWFLKFKLEIIEKGILHFDDAYFLANSYLNRIPQIKEVLQKRFSYVFVDEMQDMDTYQYDIIEKVFYNDGNSGSIIQRIGDKNQSIYNSVKEGNIWQDRQNILRIGGSMRLSSPIAEIVKNFALHTEDDFDIIGLNECTIKPHILLFEDSSITNVITKFAEIIKECKESNQFINLHYPFKAICWNTEWKNQNDAQNISKARLTDYHNTFTKENNKSKIDFKSLKSYLLHYDKKRKTLEPIRKNILNFFLKILRMENISYIDGSIYTKRKMIDFIKSKNVDLADYNLLNLNLYNWCIDLLKEKLGDVLISIKEYLPQFFALFSNSNISQNTLNFINLDTEVFEMEEDLENIPNPNIYKLDDIEIEITSVHAVKGQTHCATLYLESFFERGYGNYESERLRNQFLENQTVSQTLESLNNSKDKIIQSSKMAYVGFSRPTDLLCVAIHKNRFNERLSNIDRNKWEIIEI